MLGRAALISALLLLAACTPRNLSPECKDRVDHCLKDCPPVTDHMGIGGGGMLGIGDTRTECERRCHIICTGDRDETFPDPPDEGIPTL